MIVIIIGLPDPNFPRESSVKKKCTALKPNVDRCLWKESLINVH